MGKFWSLLFLAVPILGVATFAAAPYFNHWLPVDVSEHGGEIDHLWTFILWLTDRNDLWRQRGLELYQHMKQYNRVRYGYTIATNVTTTPPALGDFCSGYWWSEQMKYYFLMFAQSDRFDYANNYLSTEGNVLRGLL